MSGLVEPLSSFDAKLSWKCHCFMPHIKLFDIILNIILPKSPKLPIGLHIDSSVEMLLAMKTKSTKMDKTLLYQFISLLPEGASENAIERTYKTLARHYHPDKNPHQKEWAETKMKQLNEARELLSNSIKRTAYLNEFKAYQNGQASPSRTLQQENYQLKRKLESSNQTNSVLGFALLLLGGVMLAGD